MTPTVVANSFKRLFTGPPVARGFGVGPHTVTGDESAGTVIVTVSQPFSGLIYNFSRTSSAVICPKGLADPASLATTSQGSGPFVLDSTLIGDQATLVARKDWAWGPNGLTSKVSGFPEKLIWKVVANDATAANLITTGGLDIAGINGPDGDRLAADSSVIRRGGHGYSSIIIFFNQAEGRPGSDIAVRQALSTAIDGQTFGKVAYRSSTPSSSFLSPDANCFDASTKALIPAIDVAKAKQIMTAAGYKTGSDGKWLDKSGTKPLTISVVSGQDQGEGPDYIQAQALAAGFDAKLTKGDRSIYAGLFVAGNFDITVYATPSDNPDPNGIIEAFTGKPRNQGGANSTYRQYADIDAAVVAANAATTQAESCKQWGVVQQEFLKRFIMIPTVVVQYQWFSRGIDYVDPPIRTVIPMFLKRVR